MAAHKLVGLIICCKDWYETPRKWQCQPPTPSISSLNVTRNSNNILNSKGMARARGQHGTEQVRAVGPLNELKHVTSDTSWLVVPVNRSFQSPIWIWLINYLHLH